MWAIASDDRREDVEAFRDALGLELPILFDEGGRVQASWPQDPAFPTAAFPQDWIVGTDGTIAYVDNAYVPAAMRAVLDAELQGG